MDVRAGSKVAETTAVEAASLVLPPKRGWIVLSPLNRRRWNNFKANQRGFWSLWLFLVMFVISLFAGLSCILPRLPGYRFQMMNRFRCRCCS